MELDFSFALVSSLTPRGQITKTPLAESKGSLTKTLRGKDNCSRKQTTSCVNKKQLQENTQIPATNKENISPSYLMNKNGVANLNSRKSSIQNHTNVSSSPDFTFNMANIAIRRKKIENKATVKKDNEQQQSKEVFTKINTNEAKFQRSLLDTSNQVELGGSTSEPIHTQDRSSCDNLSTDLEAKQTAVRRKSVRLSGVSKSSFSINSSIDLVESSFIKNDETQLNNPALRKTSFQSNDSTEKTLSPAYDSDSISKTCKPRRVKVIQETPETDVSGSESIALKDKNNSSKTSVLREEKRGCGRPTLKTSNNLETDKRTTRNNTALIKRGLINLSNTSDDSLKNSQFEKTFGLSNESVTKNIVVLDSSTEDCTLANISVKKTDSTTQNIRKKEKRKLCSDEMKVKRREYKRVNKELSQSNLKRKKDQEIPIETSTEKGNNEEKREQKNSEDSYSSITKLNTSKSFVLPPAEVIPKFEHINNWLKDAQSASVISISSESPCSPRSLTPRLVKKFKEPVTLSPRIKKKKKIAQKTLEEEQKLFEELYGNNVDNRVNEKVEDNLSIISSEDSVELSENLLNELYGNVWQKKNVLPQSEPTVRRKKVSKKEADKALRTERKKQRTSIYDVFSSSSSEDRFEEFLESVQRGKSKSRVCPENRPGTPDFIKNSDSDSSFSPTFYQNILSSAVKEEINKERVEGGNNVKPLQVNQRRLSFSSSKDDQYSESGRSDPQYTEKDEKNTNKGKKKRIPKSASKTKTAQSDNQHIEINEIDKKIFTLVTPFKIKDKEPNDKLNKKGKTKNIDSEVPKSVGKSKTSQKISEKDVDAETEMTLRKKYLKEDDFKVPKNFTLLKTPTKPIKTTVPSSPALSFLSSLSEMTGGLPCHPDALIYKREYKSRKEELSKKLFSLYNKDIFENKLPEDLLIQWNTRMRSTSGYCYNKRIYKNNHMFRSSRIVLSTKILDRPDRLRDTLIHELCHAATWILDGTSDGHGPKWKAWADKAHRRFPELPVIKRCHDYAISTKYTYKCMSCGYCVGRHSKSLDIDRKRCGFCYGKFQVFVTAKMATASATSGSDSVKTVRNPTGFALFVKENYATVKKDNNVPHAEVMKLLSQKFAEVKILKQNADIR